MRDRHPAVRAHGSGCLWSPWRSPSPPTRSCAGCARPAIDLPLIPLLVGGQAMIWLTWPFGTAGLLGAYRRQRSWCAWSGAWSGRGFATQPVNYLRDVSATVFLAAWVPLFASFGALLIFQDHGGAGCSAVMLTVVVRRHRRLRRRGVVRQAPDGAGDQPEEVVGGPRRLAAVRHHRRGAGGARSCRQAGLGRRAAGPDAGDHRRRWATWSSPRSSATSASRTWARCCPRDRAAACPCP